MTTPQSRPADASNDPARQRPTRESVGPSSVSDQATAVDTLGFKPYVEAVAAFLTHPDTRPPLTLSVEGAWGSGKSSFMLQLEERLKQKGGRTVWFNAWRHDKEDQLWAAFALDFTTKLAATVPIWKRWILHLKLAYFRFDWSRGWFNLARFVVLTALLIYVGASLLIGKGQSTLHQLLAPPAVETTPGTAVRPADQPSPQAHSAPEPKDLLYFLLRTGGTAAYLLLAFAVLRRLTDVLGNPFKLQIASYISNPNYEGKAAFIETFHSDFRRLVRTYARGSRVFVFVDDLDRCEVPKAAELMQALNLLISESAPIFYILGLDRQKIAAGLAAKYEKLLPYLSKQPSDKVLMNRGLEFGYTYLEKFIQLPFLVPQPTANDIERLLDSLGSGANATRSAASGRTEVDAGLLVELSADSAAVREVTQMVAPSLDYNPRRMKQFVSLFRLRALLASQTGLFGPPRDSARFDPLTFGQLAKLVAIVLRWPMLFADVEEHPGLFDALQARAWGSPLDTEVTDSTSEFWANRKDLMELIALPVKDGIALDAEAKGVWGLHRVDIERFMRVSPPVAGRQLGPAESPFARTVLPSAPRGKGESVEELRQKGATTWEELQGNAEGSGLKSKGPPA
jgi:hypothetical protein